MNYKEVYKQWLNNDFFDEETKADLLSIQDDEAEIEDRFYKGLEFGTAGLRGKLGAGTNRMNKYMVGKAAQALAETLKDHGEEAIKRGVAISYDVRYKSKEFAELTCSIMAAHGIKTYIYNGIHPTPMCSYAIRKLHCKAGVMVTASHNPQEYNGYKAYWEEGSQILDDIAGQIAGHMDEIVNFEDIKSIPFEEALESGLANYIDASVEEDYYQEVLNLTINEDVDKSIKVGYTPLNGTGNIPVREILTGTFWLQSVVWTVFFFFIPLLLKSFPLSCNLQETVPPAFRLFSHLLHCPYGHPQTGTLPGSDRRFP